MESIIYASKTELARNTRKIVRAAQQGQTVVIEHHGEEEVAIVDIIDHRILQALARFHHDRPDIEQDAGLTDEQIEAEATAQDKYNLIIGTYLAEGLSLSRTAELLKLPWVDLRSRFNRLNVPMFTISAADVATDLANLETYLEKTPA